MFDSMQERLQKAAGAEMPVAHDTRLTSTEIAALWTTYMDYSMVNCVYKHFLSQVESGDVRSLLEYDLDLADKRTAWVKDTFERDSIPVPKGFTDEDVNIHAPRLYSDSFYLYYILNKARIAMPVNGLALTTSARSDVQEFYARCCGSTAVVSQKVTNLLLAKGLYVRSPYITVQKTGDTVKKQNFMAGFLGERRPLSAAEISGLNYGVRMNNLGRYLLIGFRQVTSTKQLRDYLDRGVEMSKRFIERYSSFLAKENISSPMPSETFVTDSTVSPFSERLIMNHTLFVAMAGLSSKGAILSTCFRRDISSALTLSMTEIANYLDDGLNIAIKNTWMEEPPLVVDRKELVSQLKH
ncbi:MAG: DUF3231 family protein [Firmicutes bacterium]|nr:DUF3231 family protein [Bacillota bacterium]